MSAMMAKLARQLNRCCEEAGPPPLLAAADA